MENINLRWSLKDLFISTDDAQYLHHSQVLEDLVSVFEKQRDELTEAIQDDVFIQLIQQLEKIHETFDILYGFVGLKFHENTQDQAALAHLTREEQKAAYIENRCMFFTLWWKDLPRAAAEHLLAISGDYHYWLEKLRSFKAHSLSEPEEM